MIGQRPSSTAEYSLQLTNGGDAALASYKRHNYCNIRFYRGTTAGLYNSYVDLGLNSYNIVDNGVFANGCPWIQRTESGLDDFLSATYYKKNIDGTVEIKAASIPTVGTWKQGDKIINNNLSASTTEGWICTKGGTPGEWNLVSTFDGDADTVGGYTIWTGTQAQYDAIETKSNTTLYFIKEG